MDDVPRLVSKRVRVENCEDAINSAFIQFGWSDGLPIVPPTPRRVLAMLDGTTRSMPPWADDARLLAVLLLGAVLTGVLLRYGPIPGLLASLAMLALTGVVAFLHDSSPTLIFALIAGLFVIYGSCGAVGMIPFMTIVSDSMPASLRGRFFGLRWLIGGLMGVILQ